MRFGPVHSEDSSRRDLLASMGQIVRLSESIGKARGDVYRVGRQSIQCLRLLISKSTGGTPERIVLGSFTG